ncbi:RICIN domain-containing protein [Streptomyces sp. NPDC046237]|uniref:RICIN domain-containing protein n=1 Tax=Streptomyces sp. NPDC046237 TaxID=3154914 RepID=UPI0033FFA60B
MQRTMKFNPITRARRGLLVLAASLGLVLGISAVPAQAAPIVHYASKVELRMKHSNQCLEVADWSTANGAAVRQWPCTGGANQQWYRVYLSDTPIDGYYYKNANSGKCLEIGGWGRNNGATANQWDCHFGLNQLFLTSTRLVTDPAYVWNKCLEIADWSTQPGARARLWDCHGGANQSITMRLL